MGLITTCLLKFPGYWHIFNMMSTIYLQEWAHQRAQLDFGQRSVKENANAGKTLSCIKPSKPHQFSEVLYIGWFKWKVKRSLSTKQLHLSWYSLWVGGDEQLRTFWSWDCCLDISFYWCLRKLSYINFLTLLLALVLSFIIPWKLWLYCIL